MKSPFGLANGCGLKKMDARDSRLARRRAEEMAHKNIALIGK